MKTCSTCGSQCQDNAVFCTHCGNGFPNDPQPSSTAPGGQAPGGNPYGAPGGQAPGGNPYGAPGVNGYQYDPSMNAKKTSSSDTGSVGYFFLGLFFPMICLIIYFVTRNDSPKNAKKMLTGLITGFALQVVGVIAYLIFVFAFSFFAASGGLEDVFYGLEDVFEDLYYEFAYIFRTISAYVLK